VTEYEGTCCVVLHTHLPWLAHAGTWPVGEEWLYQAFTGSYRRVVRVLEELAAEGRTEVLTLGVTPVVAAMLDDPYCLRELHTWAGNWRLRAEYAAGRPELGALAAREYRAATACLADLEARWLSGGLSSVLRPLRDAGVVEVLGGPATHPFQPLLDPRLRAFALRLGLDDARLRLGGPAPAGIWAPECGYAPGMEDGYAAAGVQRFLVDGPTLRGDTGAARPVRDSGVAAFGRDLEVTYRVWSPRAGYPGDPRYRDFHTFDHPTGFRPARVTSKRLPPEAKRPYDPDLATAAVAEHVDDFVRTVRDRLAVLRARHDRPGLVVVAYDTELFGHWWYEGPEWLAGVLRALPAAGVRVTTLAGALDAGHLGPPVDLPAGSWGSGKDWRVWDGEQVADLVDESARVRRRLLELVDAHGTRDRSPALDQLVREALLALSSDWAFMVTKDSAAGYARGRFAEHVGRFEKLAALLGSGDERAYAAELARVDGPFGHLDARQL
jgi:1,4-alpha-glucan branching enzyme